MATTVAMPQLGETVTEGTILSWAKSVGDTIAEDEVLVEISTDKVDTEVPSPVGGVVLDILVAEGDTVEVGTPLVVIGEAGEATAPTGAETPDSSPQPPAEPEPATEAAEPAVAAAVAAEPAVAVAAEPAVAAQPAIDVPDSVGLSEATEWPVVTSVASAELKERTSSVIPRWLMSVFFVVPVFALGYLLVFTGGTDCGDAGQLQVDRFGQVVNCDGTPFEGKAQATAGLVDYFALGAEVYGQTGSCAGCHGDNGEGGAGPAFAGGAVTAAFSVCEEHVVWVRLGTQAFGAEVGSTYGDLAKPVGGGGVMPGFSQLSDDELRGVVLYERVRWGGVDEATALVNCRLVTPEGEGDTGEQSEDEADGPADDMAEGIEASAGAGS